MRILIVGAGGIGGYFGGRLLEAGCNVTFLVRPGRAVQLTRDGLVIHSSKGNARISMPRYLLADQLTAPFDLVILSCKAYDLSSAMDAFAPGVGPDTAILPLLNGMRHLDILDARFGGDSVLGAECLISSTLDADGRVIHLNDTHELIFGEKDGARTARVEAIAAEFAIANFDGRHSEITLQEMWEKWVFIAATAGITCLMRSAVGDIVAAGAAEMSAALFDECAAIAENQGFPPRQNFLDRTRRMLAAPGSLLTASMLRDIERGAPIEASQILGDLLHRAGTDASNGVSLLRIAVRHVNTYEARRTREHAEPTG